MALNDDASGESGLRRVVRLVALLNLGYFVVEFAVALRIGSVSLFADSVDFLEDASVNLLILATLGCLENGSIRLESANRKSTRVRTAVIRKAEADRHRPGTVG